MSFMPNVGTVVRLRENDHIWVVTRISPTGQDDEVADAWGQTKTVTASDIGELLSDEPEGDVIPYEELRKFYQERYRIEIKQLLPEQMKEQYENTLNNKP